MNPINRYEDLLGFHLGGGTDCVETDVNEMRPYSRVMQFFASNPKTWTQPDRARIGRILGRVSFQGIIPIFHCPYLINTSLSNENAFNYTVTYVKNFLTVMRDMQSYYPVIPITFVQHTGKVRADFDPIPGMTLFMDKILKHASKINLKDFNIALETDAHFHPQTNPDGLFKLVDGIPHFSVCFDTEHAYASGWDLNNPISDSDWQKISVIHLNAIPEEVRFGSGLDRHSFTALEETTNDKDFIEYFFTNAIFRNIPMILERRDRDVIKRDIQYLNKESSYVPIRSVVNE